MSDITFKVENFNQATGNYVINDINNIDKTFFKLLLSKGVTSITVDSGQIISDKRVHDGDTVMLGSKGNGISIRFMHSDTPEEKQTTFDGRQIGIEARNKLIAEVKKTTKLTIAFDPTRPLDVYDRILGQVHPGVDSSSESINVKMVKSGYAQYYNFEDSDPANVRAEWESYAKEGITNGVGKDVAYNPKATTPREYRHIVSDTYKAFLIKKLEQANIPVSEQERKLAFYELSSLEKKVKTAYPNIRLDIEKNKIIQDIIIKGESEQLKYFTPEEIQKYQEENAKKLSEAGYKTDKVDKKSKSTKTDDKDEDKTPDSILKESVETIIINGLELPLLPTDMTSFRDNAILEEVYIRAHGAFAFRSKFSRTEIQFTLAIPIPENTTVYKVPNQEKDMWEKGLQIVASLDAYPFSFIKSNRIKSYLGTNTAPSSGDLMMFGNKKITITQDYRLSNMMLVDIVLLYCNHNALVKDFALKKDFSVETETTDVGDVIAEDGTVLKVNKDIKKTVTAIGTGSTNALIGFTDVLREGNIGKVKGFIEAHNKGYSNFDNDNKLPHVHIKVPHFVDLGGIVEDVDGKQLHSEIASIPKDLPKEDRIEIKLPRPFDRGEVMLNNDNFVSSQEEIPDPTSAIKEPAVASMDLYNVIWLEDTVAYNNSVNPIHSIVLTKERSFASHFVGAYQHPYLQYMGRFPARLTINSAFVSSNYDESTSLPYLFNIMLGVIDSNATLHPNANAYNYVKVETLSSLLLDTTHFIPNQSQITAKSDSSNMELFSCSFVENSMDKMIENCKVRIGKAIVNPEVSVNAAKLITAYLTNLEAWLGKGNTYKSEEEENYHSQIIDGLVAIVKDIKGEMPKQLAGQSTQEQAANVSAGPEKDKSEEYAEAWLASKLSTTSMKLADITKNTATRDKFIKDWYLPVCSGSSGIKGVKIGDAKEIETYCTLPMQKVLANGGKATVVASNQKATEAINPSKIPKYHVEAAKAGYVHMWYGFANESTLIDIPSKWLELGSKSTAQGPEGRKLKPATIKGLEKFYNNLPAEYKNKIKIQSAYRGRNFKYPESVSDMSDKAPAGYSEHNTGFAIDLGINGKLIAKGSPEAKIVVVAMQGTGFRLSFTEDLKNVTNISYEPWHWAYVEGEAFNILHADIIGKVSDRKNGTVEFIKRKSEANVTDTNDSSVDQDTTTPVAAKDKDGNPTGSSSWSKLPEYSPSEYTGTSDLTKAKEIIPLLEYRAKMNKARSKTEGGMSDVDLANSEEYTFNIFVENKIKGIGLLIDHAYVLNYPSMVWVKKGKASKEDFQNSSRLNDNWLNSFLGHSYPDLGFEKLIQQDSFRRDRALQNINPTFFLDTQKLLSKDEYDIAMQIVDLTNSVDITGEVTTNLEIDESKDQEEDGHYTVRGTVTREGDQKASRPLRESRYMQVEGQATVDSVYGDDGVQRPGDSSTYGNSVLGGGAFSPDSEKLFGKLELSAGLSPQIGLGKDAEIRAALDLISRAEGTHEAKGGKGYAQTVYGQSIIGYPGAKAAFPDWRVGQPHPGAHGRNEKGSAYVGKNRVGQDIYSDATGRYQYMYDTWSNMSGGNLGMDAKTQDDRALTLMGSAAIQKLKNKDWLGFCKDNRVGSQWASFPTNNYHQGAKTAEQLASALASLYDFYSGSGSNTSDIAKSAIAQNKPSSAVISSVTKVKAGSQTLDFKLWKPTANKKTGKPFEKNESTWVSSTYTLGVLSVQDGKTFLANDVGNPNDVYKITVDGIIVPEPQTRALKAARKATPGSDYSVDKIDRNGEMYGTQSAEALKNKIEGYRVKVTVGFGNAVVKLGDGFKYDLAEWLVYSGNARVDPSKKSKFPKLVQLEADAKKAGRGIWQYPQALSGERFNPITNLTVRDPILKGKAPDKTGTVENRKWYELNRAVDVTSTEVAAATEATGVAIAIDPKIQKAVEVAKAQAGVITKRAISNGRQGPVGRKYVGSIRLCSAYVADALYQGGLGDAFASSPGGQWNHTKNFLKSHGFTRIPIDSTWMVGDLVVMQVPNSPGATGHIAIFTGSGGGTTGWISDFVQKHPGVYKSKGDSPAVLYRCTSMLGNVKPYSGNNTWDKLSQMKSQGAMTTSGYYTPGVDPANVTSYPSKERMESLSLKQVQGFEIKDVDFEDVPNASVYSRDLRINKFGDKMIKSFRYGLDTCFPVVKAYLVIGNEDDDFFIDMVPLFSSAYYELPPLQSFNLDTNNDMNPLDIATFSIINPSAMRSMLSEYIETSFGNMDIGNVHNQYFHRGITDKLALKAGLRVHIRAGYSNDPNQLTPIFNGVIRETSGLKDRVIECVAESYSSELLDNYMGPAKAISLSGRHHASTGLVLAYALLMDNINHFGAQIGRFQLAKAWMGSFVGAPVDLWQSFFQSAFGISNKAALAGIGVASGALLGASIGSLFGPVGTLVGGAAGGIWAGFAILKSPATDENGLTYNTQEQTMSDNIFGGKGRRGDFRDPENKALVAPVSAGNFLWNAFNVSRGNLSQRLFVNIFSDSIEEIHGMFKDEWWNRWKQLLSFDVKVFYRFFVYKSTAWTIIKEMEYRHPGTLAKPLVYEDRQSMFFGVKEQLYVARDLDPVFMNKCGFASRFKERYTPFTEIYLAERHKRLEPATGFHIINSRVNLLSNNLSLNRDFATKVTAQYFETKWDAGEEKTEPFTETVLLDRTLSKFDVKEKVISLGGCHGNYLALLYATQELKKEMEKMYGGKILITGNPEMRAGDYAYIEDTDRNLAGVIKIRECQHHFSPTDGYVTEITPGLYVEATHFMWDDLFTQLNMASRLLSTKLSMEQTSNNIGNQVRDNYFEMLKIMQEIKDPSASDYAYMFGGYLLVAGVGYLSARTLLKRLGGSSKIGSYGKFLISIVQSSKNVGVPAIRTMVKSLRDKGIKIAEQIDDDATRAATQKGEKALAEYEKNKAASNSMMQKAKNKLKGTKAALGFADKNAHTVKMPGMRQILADRNWALMKKLGVKRVLAKSVKGAVMASIRTGWRFMSPKGVLKGGPLMVLGLLLAWNYGLSVTRKLELTTNPITFFPLMYGNDPYTAGISGFSNKGLIDAAYENLIKNTSKLKMHGGIADAAGGNTGFNYAHIAGLTMKLFAQTEETAGGALLSMMGANTDIKGDNKSKRIVDAKSPDKRNSTPAKTGNVIYHDAIESDDSTPDSDA